ncbi:MAG TPA: DUF4124 domain-containing protein [Steroidobacter sp.]
MRTRASKAFRPVLVLIGCAFALAASHAEIYTCIGEDGSRVFSDQRCGPDAKVVPGVSARKAAKPKPAATSKPRRERKPPEELERLLEQCNEGDLKACKEWTLGGGPALLREKELEQESDCEAGSLAACEERYCGQGIDADCRARVLRTARLAGDTWYLRGESHPDGRDGLARYDIRCIPEGVREPRDIVVSCSRQHGPNRCFVDNPERGFARLVLAAVAHCSHLPTSRE